MLGVIVDILMHRKVFERANYWIREAELNKIYMTRSSLDAKNMLHKICIKTFMCLLEVK